MAALIIASLLAICGIVLILMVLGTKSLSLLFGVLSSWPAILSVYGIYRLWKKQGNKWLNLSFIPLGILFAYFNIMLSIKLSFFFNIGLLLLVAGIMVYLKFNKKPISNVDNVIEERPVNSEYELEVEKDQIALEDRWEKVKLESDWTFDFQDDDELLLRKQVIVDQEKEMAFDEEEFLLSSRPRKQASDPKKANKRVYEEEKVEKLDKINTGFKNLIGNNKIKNKLDNIKSGGFTFNENNYLKKEYVFSSQKEIMVSEGFKGGKISSVFSETWLDFARVKGKDTDIRLKADVVFATLNIRVPNDWIIYMNGQTVFGEVNIPDKPAKDPKHRLIIDNQVVFGSLRLEYKD